jgi:carbon monoxide dehydrogenase subunit G
MDLTGSYSFPAPPERVWQLLMDPSAIAGCIPGCESLEADGEDRYRARLTVALAAITGTYDGTVVISDKVPYDSYTLGVEGQGKPGFVKGVAKITLRPEGGSTTLNLAAALDAGGPIARVGQRLIGSVAKMMQDRFFACLKTKL